MPPSLSLLAPLAFPLAIAFALALLAAHPTPTCAAENPSPGRFRAGAALVDITPTNYPVLVNAMFTERTATQAVDRLHVRALVLDDGTRRVAFAVVDTCMIPRSLIDQAKALARNETGIPTDHLLVSATHTHSAPSAMGCLGSRVDPAYAAFLPGRIAEAIARANRQLAPAQVAWGATNDWDHTFNRRWIRRPDRLLTDPFGQPTVRAHMHPGHQSPDALGPSGPVDPALSLLALRTVDGQPLAVLANYSQHYYGSPLLSSDYYGRFADHLTRLLLGDSPASPAGDSAPAFVAIMSQGTSGDLMWMDYAAPRQEIGYDAYARELADRAAAVYRRLPFRDHAPIGMAESRLPLGYRVPDPARLAWARATQAALGDRLPQSLPEIYALEALDLHERPATELVLQALRVGDLGITAIPNEVFALTGLKLKARSPLPLTFNIELANGAEGYIPPPEQHALGGYTTWPARTAGLETEAEPKIVEALLQLLETVAGQPRRTPPPAHGPYARTILQARPLGYWRLDDPTFPAALDASDHGRHARFEPGVALFLPGAGTGEGISPNPQLTPSPFSGPDALNRAVHFAGGRASVTLPDPGPDRTLECWAWNGLTNSARPVTGFLATLAADPAPDPAASVLQLGLTGTLHPDTPGRLFLADGDPLHPPAVGRTPLGLRTWHHVVLVQRGDRVAVYLDGRPEPEIDTPLPTPTPAGRLRLLLGGRPDGYAGFEGRLDEVALYDRALEPAEITAHFRLAQPPTPAPPPANAASPAASSPAAPGVPDPIPPEQSLARIHVPDGFRVELVAAEPLVVDPVALDWDIAGRLWVVEMADYPLGIDGNGKPGGRIRVLEDTDDDGRYDRARVFAEGLEFPNGILTWRDGILVTAAPNVLFLRDTNGDGQADEKRVLLSGFLEGNQQLRVNGLRWGLDNWVYCAAGGHHRGHGAGTVIHSALTGLDTPLGSRDFRFQPDTGAFDPQSGPTQFGRNRDDWGHWFGTQNSWPLWHYVLPDPYLRRNPHIAAPDPVRQVIRPMNPKVYPASRQEKRFHSFNEAGHFTSACAGMVYRDDLLFPDGPELHAFACEPFHNLVHRELLRDDGVSFSASRPPAERDREFFASEDRWCRPVMTRTGPDGALWVVDMYRYMIEHPQWLPPEGRAELLPHYRLGDDRGRLYRVLPAGTSTRRPPRLDRLDTAGLIELLASPNGWLRDKAQQLLLWRADRTAVPALASAATTHASPRARLHALATLDGLDALPPAALLPALAHAHPGLRENGLRLAESHPSPAVLDAALRLVDDPDPKVRLQLAFSLGAWTDPRAGTALGRLAIEAARTTNTFLLAAVFSSATPHAPALAEAALSAGGRDADMLVPSLVQFALAADRRDLLARLLAPLLAPVPTPDADLADRLNAFARFLDLLARAGRTPADLARDAAPGDPDDPLASLLPGQARLLAAATRLAASDQAEPAHRIAAAAFLTWDPPRREAALLALVDWLDPRIPPRDQRAALDALAGHLSPDIAALLLRRWDTAAPEIRNGLLDLLSSREPGALALLLAVRSGTVAPQFIDATRRARLVQHPTPKIRDLAVQAFQSSGAHSDRAAVIRSFQPALALPGDFTRGAVTFDRLCLPCHQRGGRGNPVGPDLRSVAGHPPEKLLVSILDPSADVQPGYHAYHCTLRGGEELYGVIAAETGNSLVLALADGSRRTLLRSDLVELRGSRLSLMPEGLEAGLTPADLADLLALLRTPAE
jgi:putative membrane-bound dehydrogenase-like protein